MCKDDVGFYHTWLHHEVDGETSALLLNKGIFMDLLKPLVVRVIEKENTEDCKSSDKIGL